MQNGAGYRIALATQGTRGDFQPMLALARAFQKQGHAVKLFCNPDHCTMAASFNLDATVACDEVKDMLKTEAGMKSMETGDLIHAVAAKEQTPEETANYDKTFCEEMRDFKPDVCLFTNLIADRVVCYSYFMMREFPVPFINCVYQPQVFPTDEFGPIAMYRVALEEGQPMLTKWVTEFQAKVKSAKEGMDYGAAQGIPEEELNNHEGVEGWWFTYWCPEENTEPKILAYSRAFWGPPSDWPAEGKGYAILGQWQIPKDEQEEQTRNGQSMFSEGDEFQRCVDFIQAGSPPVYIGWGSMTVYSGEHMAILAAETLMKSGQRGIIVSGWAGMDSSALQTAREPDALKAYSDANILWMKAAPHEWLFPQCAVCVHHGGIGTAQASLRAGTPTIVTPVFADQHDIAHRIAKLGWGLGTCLLAKLTSDELAEKVKACVGNVSMKAKVMALAEKMVQEDGTTATVDFVTNWVRDVIKTGKWQEAKKTRQERILELRRITGKLNLQQLFSFFDSRLRERYPTLKAYAASQIEVFAKLATLAKEQKLWVVRVGSCLARAGEKLKSEERGRFQEFSMLEELELKGSRLHAKLLQGNGPAEGWISLQANSVDLVSRLGPQDIGVVQWLKLSKQFADIGAMPGDGATRKDPPKT